MISRYEYPAIYKINDIMTQENTSLHFGTVCHLQSAPHCTFIILIVQFCAQASFALTQLKAPKSGADGQVAKTTKPPHHSHANWEIICV